MSGIRFPIAALLTWMVLSPAQSLLAQRNYPYTPSRPTISPYFNYFRGNTGGIPQYYQFVQPEIRGRAFIQNQSAFNQYQSGINQYQFSRVGGLEHQLQYGAPYQGGRPSLGTAGTTSESLYGAALTVPSTAASFMNYSHYYPQQQSVSPRTVTPYSNNVGGIGGLR